ncbi:hypothetical protein OK016_22270 [Vibrio chagasii]|nr:hypothetical protein [Vibrio chagasii]
MVKSTGNLPYTKLQPCTVNRGGKHCLMDVLSLATRWYLVKWVSKVGKNLHDVWLCIVNQQGSDLNSEKAVRFQILVSLHE